MPMAYYCRPMSSRSPVVVAFLLFLASGSVARGTSAQESLVAPALMQRALGTGAVRVIVEVGGTTFVPEGFLRDDVAIGAQRQRIAAGQGAIRQALRGLRHRVVRQFRTVPLMAIEASPDSLRMLEAMRGLVARVHEDTLNRPGLAQSGPLVGAAAAANAGFDGSGTVVAIVDTGVDKTHPFLAGKVVEEACFSSTETGRSVTTCPNGLGEQIGPGAGVPCSVPGCEHGTHVAGIAAGNGAGAGQPFSGVARGARIMAVQVFSRFTTAGDCDGSPPCAHAYLSDLIAALERVYSLRTGHNLAAVNLSLGGGGPFTTPCDTDLRKPIVDMLRAAGIATIASSGNDGFTNAMGAPACISTVVSVAATTKSDAVSSFSNVASFLSLFAPGSAITSSVPGGSFAAFSGTSMAAPHVAGAFAILKQAVPGASVSQMLQALQASGHPITDVTGLTKPRIQIDAALSFFGQSALGVFVSGLYQDVLGRAPEPAGLGGWVGFLQANCNPAGFSAIGVAFFDSPEFRSVRALSLDGLVTALYRAFLDRDPEPGGLAGWAQHFRSERALLAREGFVGSQEFQRLLPNRSDRTAVTAVVTRLYNEILGRAPEPAGLEGWVNYILTTGDLEGAAVAFITSSEFEARPVTLRGFVTILYRAFLGREPEPAGLDGWEGVLRQHLIDTVQAGFVSSGEFQGKVPQLCGA